VIIERALRNARFKRDTTNSNSPTFGDLFLAAAAADNGCYIGCLHNRTGADDQDDNQAVAQVNRKKRQADSSFVKWHLTIDLFEDDNATAKSPVSTSDLSECVKLQPAKECVSECGNNGYAQMVYGTMRPLEYICKNSAEFVKQTACYDKIIQPADCAKKCGGKTTTVYVYGDESNTTAISTKVGNMCGFVNCHMSCLRPAVLSACANDVKAADLREEFIANFIDAWSTSMFSAIGMSAVNPLECQKLHETARKFTA